MAPFSLAGAIAGVTALVTLPQQATIIAFGIFLCGYGAYSLRTVAGPAGIARHPWAVISGFCGGATGTLFGAGAPPYAIYLSRRLPDKAVLRATLSNMVLLSTAIRALVFLAGGLMLMDRVIGFLSLLPFALGGLCGAPHPVAGLARSTAQGDQRVVAADRRVADHPRLARMIRTGRTLLPCLCACCPRPAHT